MEIMDLYNLRIKETIDTLGLYMLKNPNIVAIARGKKVINGHRSNKPALVFYVAKKLGRNYINKCDLIPQSVKGVSTDVIESGCFRLLNDNRTISPKAISNRPALGGGCVFYDINGDPTKQRIGTLTYAFTDKNTKSKIYFLTSEHVVSGIGTKSNTPIQYISVEANYEKRWILGTIVKKSVGYYSKDLKAFVFPVDAGLGLVGPNNEETRKNKIMPGLLNGKVVTGTQSIVDGDKVYKYGESSGLTTGIVTGTNARVKNIVDEGIRFSENQILVNQVCKKGDSGALGVVESTGKAFGMLNAGVDKDTITTYSDIETVMKYFNIELLV